MDVEVMMLPRVREDEHAGSNTRAVVGGGGGRRKNVLERV